MARGKTGPATCQGVTRPAPQITYRTFVGLYCVINLARLVDELSAPTAYPEPVTRIEVRQTHISVVFLTDFWVYKIRKPVKLAFLDFSTLELRQKDCEAELRLNTRLAPHIYESVVPITIEQGRLRFEGSGTAVEWAVKMRRLPDDATLESQLDSIDITDIQSLGQTIALFHQQAERGEQIASFGSWKHVAQNARNNFSESQAHVGHTISRSVFERLSQFTNQQLTTLRPIIESRAARHLTCDTHGDLRIDHVYLLDDPKSGPQTAIIDCIEFNDSFRYADPVSDVAFLAMDLKFAGYPEFAHTLTEAYFAATCDEEGRTLLPFYTAYRAAVRGKVEGIKSLEHEVPPDQRAAARQRAQGYWLLALQELASPSSRPALLLTGGLPGSGKSTFAAALAAQHNFSVLRTDVIRKQLAASRPAPDQPIEVVEKNLTNRVSDPGSTHANRLHTPQAASQQAHTFAQGIYTPDWNDRVYAECLRQAEELLFNGERVIVDASFREDERRRVFIEMAQRIGVPVFFLEFSADPAVIQQRLAHRKGDASDADWSVYRSTASIWQECSPVVVKRHHTLDTGQPIETIVSQARSVLQSAGLVDLPAL